MPRAPLEYTRTINAARQTALLLTRRSVETFAALLRDYADELDDISALPVREARQVARRMYEQLQRRMARTVRSAVTLTANRTERLVAQATASVMEGSGLVAPSFAGLGATTVQAMLARPQLAQSFRSLRTDHYRAVDSILLRKTLRGATSAEIARELRVHVQGAESLPVELLTDRRRIGKAAVRAMGYEGTPFDVASVRRRAGLVANRAQLIARTEAMAAQHEARAIARLSSPVVMAAQWELSAGHPMPDECDALAEVDWYGMGPGVYPVDKVPPRPHPRCICITFDVLFPPEQWGSAQPSPDIRGDWRRQARRLAAAPSRLRGLTNALTSAIGREVVLASTD